MLEKSKNVEDSLKENEEKQRIIRIKQMHWGEGTGTTFCMAVLPCNNLNIP